MTSTTPLVLTFSEDGEEMGTARLDGGQLVGDETAVAMVNARMRRDGLDAAAAMRALDGWSNGYLTARLT